MTLTKSQTKALRVRWGDVPIKSAMIAWNPLSEHEDDDGRILIVPWPDQERWCDLVRLSNTCGACWRYWQDGTKKQRQLQLLIEGWHIVIRDKVSAFDVHEAFLVMPEYREMLSEDAPWPFKG